MMANVTLKNVSIDFPIMSAGGYSLRNKLLAISTGGVIQYDNSKITSIRALDDINLSLNDGDRLGIIGHNGAGKSTLLRVIAGIYAPTLGTIETKGTIATILELGAGIDPELSGYENIIRLGVQRGLTLRESKGLIQNVEEFADLGNFLHMPPRVYSSGMMLRLMFSVATAVTPEILIVDEVFGAGDKNFQENAKLRMENLISKSKIFVFTSHSEELVARLCNKIVFMKHGKLVQLN